MGVDWMFINATRGEYVFPVQYVNEKRPYSTPYAEFIVWMWTMWGRLDEVHLICDGEEELFWDYIHNKKEVTAKYWDLFCKETGYDPKSGEFHKD